MMDWGINLLGREISMIIMLSWWKVKVDIQTIATFAFEQVKVWYYIIISNRKATTGKTIEIKNELQTNQILSNVVVKCRAVIILVNTVEKVIDYKEIRLDLNKVYLKVGLKSGVENETLL